jgi:hypothetical protein
MKDRKSLSIVAAIAITIAVVEAGVISYLSISLKAHLDAYIDCKSELQMYQGLAIKRHN